MALTLGIHWIVTTHGSWLHGNPHGSWRHGRLIGPDPFLESSIRQRMTHDAVTLDQVEVWQVAAAFGDAIREHRQRVFAATIRPTHAHLVFGPLREDINTVIARLKRRAAASVLATRRQMKRPAPRSLWTTGRFYVLIDNEDYLRNAIRYVRQHNRDAGLEPDPYPWVRPWESGW
jgi:hypothetical protein